MKGLLTLLVLAAVALGVPGCGKKDDEKDKKKEPGAIDSTVDYFTGKTAVDAKFKAQRNVIKLQIQSSINMFEVENGRSPISLTELVGAGYLDKKCLNDEFGKPLEVEVTADAFIVRSIRINPDTGKRTVSWEEHFR